MQNVRTPGQYAQAELAHMRLRVSILEEALEVERDEDPSTGAKLGYRVTRAVARMTGNQNVQGCDVRRLIDSDILEPILSPTQRSIDLLGKEELSVLRKWLVSRPFMRALADHWAQKKKRRNA